MDKSKYAALETTPGSGTLRREFARHAVFEDGTVTDDLGEVERRTGIVLHEHDNGATAEAINAGTVALIVSDDKHISTIPVEQ